MLTLAASLWVFRKPSKIPLTSGESALVTCDRLDRLRDLKYYDKNGTQGVRISLRYPLLAGGEIVQFFDSRDRMLGQTSVTGSKLHDSFTAESGISSAYSWRQDETGRTERIEWRDRAGAILLREQIQIPKKGKKTRQYSARYGVALDLSSR